MKQLFAIAIIALGGVVVAGQDLRDNETQASLINALRDGSRGTRESAIEWIRLIPVADRQPALVQAVVDEAERLRHEFASKRRARESGAIVPPEPETDHTFNVVDTLAQHHTPDVIPGLLVFIENGGRGTNALADFGEQAFTPLFILASTDSGLSGATALQIFQRMLTRPSVRQPLSADSKARIIGLARARLYGAQSPVMVPAAIGLAEATNDPGLIARVKQIASDPLVATELDMGHERATHVRGVAVRALQGAGISPQ